MRLSRQLTAHAAKLLKRHHGGDICPRPSSLNGFDKAVMRGQKPQE